MPTLAATTAPAPATATASAPMARSLARRRAARRCAARAARERDAPAGASDPVGSPHSGASVEALGSRGPFDNRLKRGT
jgi:hypothetical protein